MSFKELKDIGLVKFENRNWEFIHLTFQEYFAAVHLAHFYIDGKTKKEKGKLLRKGEKHLTKIKFDPRYTLTLWMTAGYLSSQGSSEALQNFFDHLFAEPRDLAKRYEFRLFAQCFEECANPESITSQYSDFIEACVNHISIVSPEDIFDLLNRNAKLLAHKSIVDAILHRINSPRQLSEMVKILYWLASNWQILPSKLVEALVSSAGNASVDELVRESAAIALVEIARGVEVMSEAAIGALIEIFKNASLGNGVRGRTASTLMEIVKGRGVIPEAVIAALVEMVKDVSLGEYLRRKAVETLLEIVQRGGVMSKAAIGALIEIFKDASLNEYVRGRAVSTLVEIVQGGGVMFEAAIGALVEMVKDVSLDEYVRGDAIIALGEISQGENLLSITALQALESEAASLGIKGGVVNVLMQISPRSLAAVITDIDSAKLVLRICILTRKAFSVADGQIHVSDNNCRVSVPNPGVNESKIRAYAEGLSHGEGSLALLDTSSSSSSLACSSNG